MRSGDVQVTPKKPWGQTRVSWTAGSSAVYDGHSKELAAYLAQVTHRATVSCHSLWRAHLDAGTWRAHDFN